MNTYKEIVRVRHKEVIQQTPSLTLKKMASLIPIQYTYLSKVLNSDSAHLSEDHLFKICQMLKMREDETELALLLRSFETSQDSQRKDLLKNRIESFKKEKKLNVEQRHIDTALLDEEMRFLLDPLSTMIFVALDLKYIRKDPRALCQIFGISISKLKSILANLDRLGFIELDQEDSLHIKKYHNTKFHFGRSHPLMRTHQQLLKTQISSHLSKIDEENKHSFLVTFTADPNVFIEIQEEFKSFLKKVEKLADSSRHSNLYQLSFDLFKWI